MQGQPRWQAAQQQLQGHPLRLPQLVLLVSPLLRVLRLVRRQVVGQRAPKQGGLPGGGPVQQSSRAAPARVSAHASHCPWQQGLQQRLHVHYPRLL